MRVKSEKEGRAMRMKDYLAHKYKAKRMASPSEGHIRQFPLNAPYYDEVEPVDPAQNQKLKSLVYPSSDSMSVYSDLRASGDLDDSEYEPTNSNTKSGGLDAVSKESVVDSSDFDVLAVLGSGLISKIGLVTGKSNGKIGRQRVYAMKIIDQKMAKQKNLFKYLASEKAIMAQINNPWMISWHNSFVDKDHLYFVMDYMAGGDLMSLLIREDTLDEERCKFYVAEMILGIEAVHNMGYIHRDIKPDNVLLDSRGHIKISDFGLCKYIGTTPGRPSASEHEEHCKKALCT